MTTLTHLECSRCGASREAGSLDGYCSCGGILLVRYDLDGVRQGWSREWLEHAPPTMWRYAPLLPASGFGAAVSLGEGMTPLVRLARLGEPEGVANLWLKDDGVNPAGSSEARACSCVFTMARQMGLSGWKMAADAVAGAAVALYGAAAGIRTTIELPRDASQSCRLIAAAAGAQEDLGEASGESEIDGVAMLPYRLEGMKTLGLEIAEQLRWSPPAAVLCPVGDGAGIIGIWKAFQELAAAGWIAGKPPRLYAVQAEGCRPIVEAFERGAERCEQWLDPWTVAASIRVARPAGDDLILRILRETGGGAVAVRDQQMLEAGIEMARTEGVFPAPEGAACLVGLRMLRERNLIAEEETVALVNPASGLLYPEAYSARLPRARGGEAGKLGGLITPR